MFSKKINFGFYKNCQKGQKA